MVALARASAPRLLLLLMVLVVCSVTVSHATSITWKHGYLVRHGTNFTANYSVNGLLGTQRDVTGEYQLRVTCLVDPSKPANATGPLFKMSMKDARLPGSTSSKGAVTIGPLIHLSKACELTVYRRVLGIYFVQVRSPVRLTFFVRAPKTQLHLSLAGERSGMSVTWRGWKAGSRIPSVTFYPTNKPSAWRKASVNTRSYTAKDMCGGEAIREQADFYAGPVVTYHAELTSLIPDTQYTCRIGSEEHVFRSPRAEGREVRGRFLALGNMGVFHDRHHLRHNHRKHGAVTRQPSTNVTRLLQRLQQEVSNASTQPDLVVHLGNLAYASGRSFVWDYFMHFITPVSSRVPYHAVAGETEVDFVQAAVEKGLASWARQSNFSGGECGIPLANRFTMPRSSGSKVSSPGIFWFSHSAANMYLVYISTEHDLAPGSEQGTWLQAELAKVDRQTYPWLFVLGHRPLYSQQSSVASAPDTRASLRRHLNGLLHKHKVNAYLAGHDSRYLRTCAMDEQGVCVSTRAQHGLVHLTAGSAGAPSAKGHAGQATEPWIAASSSHHGFLDITTMGAKEALVRFRTAEGQTLDTATLQNNQIPVLAFEAFEEAVIPFHTGRMAELKNASSADSLAVLRLLLLAGVLLSWSSFE